MSFGNHLTFNISKASPTTSTTNATTTSFPGSLQPNTHVSSVDVLSASLTDAKLPHAHIVAHQEQHDTSPRIKAATPTTGISGINSAAVSTVESSEASKDREELLQIWGKYDVENQKNDEQVSLSAEETEDADSLEEKMKQFHMGPSNKTEIDHVNMDPSEKTPQEANFSRSDSSEHIQNIGNFQSKSNDLCNPSDTTNNTQSTLSVEVQTTSCEPAKDESNGSEAQTELDSNLNEEASLESSGSGNNAKIKEKSPSPSVVEYMGVQPLEIPGASESKPIEGNLLSMDSSEPIVELKLEQSNCPPPTRARPKRNNSVSRISPAVNPEEQYQQSHKPFDFQIFLTQLKKKSADPLVRYIRSFLVSFSRQSGSMTAPQMIKAVSHFKEFMNEKFHEYEPFASMDAVDLENSGEGVEKLIMNRLYEFCFSPEAIKKFGRNVSATVLDDVHEDYQFIMQIEKFSWILGVHLDVDLDAITQSKRERNSESIDYMDYAINELNKINKFRAPRDKIICILNACKIIFSFLRVSNQETNADSFIPILILVIIRAKAENLISNLHYIERYRGEEWLNHGETSYYLSSMQGAISFIQNIKFQDLTISQDEYDANMEAWDAELRQRGPPIIRPEPLHPGEASTNIQQSLSPSNVILAGAEMFTKSLSNFMSPTPLESAPQNPEPRSESGPPHLVSDEQVEKTLNQLTEIFPNLDRAVLRDVIVLKKADFDSSLDACLQLCNDD